jgi:hypothetical protein
MHGGVRGNTEEGMIWKRKWIEESTVKRKIPLLWIKRISRKFYRRQE